MATDKSKSQVRPSRNRAKPTASSTSTDSDSHMTRVAAATFEGAIEAERERLMSAEAVLHCVVIAMDEIDAGDTRAPHYQSVVDLARGLVQQSIDRLDSVWMRSRGEDVGVGREYGVKEVLVEYVH